MNAQVLSLPRLIILCFFLLFSCSSMTVNASLLGRLNAYYGGQVYLPNDKEKLQDLQRDFVRQKTQLQAQLDASKSPEARDALQKKINGLNSQQEDIKDLLASIDAIKTIQEYLDYATTLKQANDALKKMLIESDRLDDALSAARSETQADTEKSQGLQQGNKSKTIFLKPRTIGLTSFLSEAVKNDPSKLAAAQRLVKIANDAISALGEFSKTDTAVWAEKLTVAYAERDEKFKKSASKMVVDETINGVHEAPGDVSFMTSDANSAIGINAYKFNALLWSKKCDKAPSACMLSDKYGFIPMYLFLKKTTASQADNTSLANDLLDNEYGGNANLKFSGGAKLESFLQSSPFDFSNSDNPKVRQYGAKFVYDFGVKFAEVPPVPAVGATTATTTNWVAAGYYGIGINLELPVLSAATDFNEDITVGANPVGGLAIGFGVYQNIVDRSQFDKNPTPFTQQISSVFGTKVIMYEMQITKLISVKGTRVYPSESNSPLGTYSSFQIASSFKFD